MSTTAPRHPPDRTAPGLFAYASFAIMIGGWTAFAAALLASPQSLEDARTSIRALPLLAEGVVWLLGFPFLIGLAIWHAPWDEGVRLVTIGVLACAYTCMFAPRNRTV